MTTKIHTAPTTTTIQNRSTKKQIKSKSTRRETFLPHPPPSKASAPGKIILFGEHFVVHGTKAILGTINKKITVTSQITNTPTISIKSQIGNVTINLAKNQECQNPQLYPFEFLAKKMIKRFGARYMASTASTTTTTTNTTPTLGIKIQIKSEIPSGVGLGSSSAACVAAAASISRLFTKYTKSQICTLAIQAEKTIFENTSGADCTASTFGGLIEYSKKTGYKKIKHKPHLTFIISNSKITHDTNQVVNKVSKFKNNNPKKFAYLLKKEVELIRRTKIAIKNNSDDNSSSSNNNNQTSQTIGALMQQNQLYLKQIGVSNRTLEKIIHATNKHSFGSKITGAGAGGCIISVTNESTANQTIKKLRQKYNITSFVAKIDYTGLDTF